jgi:hypothetical protein
MPGGAAAKVPSGCLPRAQLQNVAARVNSARSHLSYGRVGIGQLRRERQPGGELSHRGYGRSQSGACAVSQRRAVVVDQTRLHNRVAHAGVVAFGQHVVVAEQVFALARVLDQRAQRAAAAIHNLVAARVVVHVVSARTAQ